MLYYYAHTGHKIGLERLRRGAALLKKLNTKGIDTQLLVNDFRAGLVAKDLGVPSYVTIETVQDIDAVAQATESIIIDSVEDDHGRLVKYCSDFKQVWRFEHSSDDSSVHGELLFKNDFSDEGSENALIIDETYFEESKKEERVVFFLSDADYDKTILSNPEFFKELNMELLLGTYFFVKYEDDLEKLFKKLHEPEDYEDVIKGSTTIVTASSQAAMEAKASKARVIYLDIEQDTIYPMSTIEKAGIEIVKGFDTDKLVKKLAEKNPNNFTKFDEYEVESIISKI